MLCTTSSLLFYRSFSKAVVESVPVRVDNLNNNSDKFEKNIIFDCDYIVIVENLIWLIINQKFVKYLKHIIYNFYISAHTLCLCENIEKTDEDAGFFIWKKTSYCSK